MEVLTVSHSTDAAGRAAPAIWLVLTCLAITYVVWGTTYFAIKVSLEEIRPYYMLGTRFLVAGMVLMGALVIAGQRLPTVKQWSNSTLLGFLMLVLGIGSVAVAEQWVTSGATVALISVQPLATALWLGVFGRWPRRLEWVAIAIGLVGTLVMVVGQDLAASPLGTGLILFATASWTFGAVISRRLDLPHGAMGFAAEMIAGGALCLVVSLLFGEEWIVPVTARVWWAWWYLVIFGSLVAFSAYRFLVDRSSPTLAATYTYVNPPVALFVGWWLGAEVFTVNIFIGLTIVLAAVALHAWLELYQRKTSAAASP
jgi:drug/metabolite transporter (DMT)-like permease